jgi:hypothetical protein
MGLAYFTLHPRLLISHNISNKAQNGNQGSILVYSLFGRFLVTGLIEALLTQYFQILAIRAWNPKSPMLRGKKPALLFPFGGQIAVQTGWSRGKGKRRAVLGIGNSLYRQKENILFYLHCVSVGDYHPGKCSRPQK